MARILLVEDEPLIASMLIDWIEELGHEVVGPTAESAQALAYVRQEAVDAAFVDIEVKDGDAYSLADELKRLLIPFTFATGYPTDTIDHRFSDIPSLGKPFDYEGFISALKRMITSRIDVPRPEGQPLVLASSPGLLAASPLTLPPWPSRLPRPARAPLLLGGIVEIERARRQRGPPVRRPAARAAVLHR